MDYYMIITPKGEFIFEGTVAQADNAFGLCIDATSAHLLAFVESQGWWLFERIISEDYAKANGIA